MILKVNRFMVVSSFLGDDPVNIMRFQTGLSLEDQQAKEYIRELKEFIVS